MEREPSYSDDSWEDTHDSDRYDPEVDNRKCLDCGEKLKEQKPFIYCPNCHLIVKTGM